MEKIEIVKNIVEMLNSEGLSNRQIAEKIDCSPSLLSMVLTGKREPTDKLLTGIKRYYAQDDGIYEDFCNLLTELQKLPKAVQSQVDWMVKNVLYIEQKRSLAYSSKLYDEELTEVRHKTIESELIACEKRIEAINTIWFGFESVTCEQEPPMPKIITIDMLPEYWQAKYVPIINKISAGLGADTLLAEQMPPGIAYKYIEWKGNTVPPPSCYALTIEGDSMQPDYNNGDIIIVDPNQHPESGIMVCLVDYPSGERQALIKKLLKDKSDIYLKSLNHDYKDIKIEKDWQLRTQKIIYHYPK